MSSKSKHSVFKSKARAFSIRQFQDAHPELSIMGVMVEKMEGGSQVVVMAGKDSDMDLLHALAQEHFGDLPYRIETLDGHPSGSSGTVASGAGIMRQGSANFGTVGGWFKMDKDRNGKAVDPSITFGVSNNHVIGLCGNGAPDDVLTDVNGVVMGKLYDVVFLDPSASNDVDLAIFKVEAGLATSWTAPTPTGWTGAQVGYSVYKHGFKTQRTEGSIVSTGDIVAELCGVKYHFSDVLAIRGTDGPFSDEGDSGSLVFTMNGLIVGLLFAKAGDFAYACRIKHLGKLNLWF